jgi:ABC-2 type transport system permease protein
MIQPISNKKNKVPGSASQLGTIAEYEFKNYFGSRRFYILLIIVLLVSALLTVVVGYYRPASFLANELGFYASWWGTSATFVIILSGIFFGGDAISGEFQNKTGYYLIPNPVRRSSIYVGKWLSAFAASAIILAIFMGLTVANGMYYFGANVPYEFVESAVFAFIYLAAVLGFTFLFSSLFKSSTSSILLTAILFLFAFSLVQTLLSSLVKIQPWFMLTYGAQIIGNVLTVPYPANIVTTHLPEGFTLTTYNATVPEGLALMLVYCVVTAILGLVLFERKDFT